MHGRVTSILLAILLFLSGCDNSAGTPPATWTPAPPMLPSATPDAVLLRVQGEVRLQRVITDQVVPASFGDGLWRGDVILTGQDAQAEALCSDGSSIRVEPNQTLTITCGETPDPIYQSIIMRIHSGQVEALPTARHDPPDYGNRPVVLSPRNTHLTDRRPTIRWLAVEGAEGYEVVVRGLDGELWRITTQTLELPYPEAQPALEARASYLIQVTARMESPAQPRPSKDVLVTVLSATDAEQVHQFETQVETLGLSAESARFFLAAYYADRELYDAAIAELVSLAEETPSAVIHRLLGDVYLAILLDGEAVQSYEEASRLAQVQGNQLVWADAEVGLGHVAYAAQDVEDALNHYQTALTLYRESGLESQAKAMEELVAIIQAQLPTPTP